MGVIETQTAAWVAHPGPNAKIEFREDAPVPSPSEGEVMVRLICTGIWLVETRNFKAALI